MGFPAVMIAKLSLITATNHGLTPLLTSLLWPFLLKFLLSFRPIQESFIDLAHTFRHFYFQMRIIMSGSDEPTYRAVRWRRAVRLLYERLNHVRATQSDQEDMHALSVIAL